jgi:hypothetical protein
MVVREVVTEFVFDYIWVTTVETKVTLAVFSCSNKYDIVVVLVFGPMNFHFKLYYRYNY